MRNVLLLMPFVMQDILLPDVKTWNSCHSRQDFLQDPSNDLVDILCDFLEWYQRFRRPGHTLADVVDLDQRGRALIQKCERVFPKVKDASFGEKGNSVL